MSIAGMHWRFHGCFLSQAGARARGCLTPSRQTPKITSIRQTLWTHLCADRPPVWIRSREADKRRQDFRTANLDILGKANGGNRIDGASAAYDQATRDYNSALARRDNVKAQLDSTPKTIAADGRMFFGANGGGPIATSGT